MLKIEFLKRIGLLASGSAIAVAATSPAGASTDDADALVGLWEMTAHGKLGTYRYYYSISRGAWVCTGNIDAGFQEFTYGPTMGAYERSADGSYRYHEKGWAFDRKGNNVGSFQSTGTFRLDPGGRSFSGPGTFVQVDRSGKQLFVEPFTATAVKLAA